MGQLIMPRRICIVEPYRSGRASYWTVESSSRLEGMGVDVVCQATASNDHKASPFELVDVSLPVSVKHVCGVDMLELFNGSLSALKVIGIMRKVIARLRSWHHFLDMLTQP